jgi:hypothetical protein
MEPFEGRVGDRDSRVNGSVAGAYNVLSRLQCGDVSLLRSLTRFQSLKGAVNTPDISVCGLGSGRRRNGTLHAAK